MTNRKKGGLDSTKLPSFGDRAITHYVRATAAQYGRFAQDTGEAIPHTIAAQSVVELAIKYHEYRKLMPKNADSRQIEHAYGRLWRRTGFLAMTGRYSQLSRGRNRKNKTSSRRDDILDAMANIPLVDWQTVLGLIEEIYTRGLLVRPIVTSMHGEILEDFQAILSQSYSIDQYIASLDRDASALSTSLEESEAKGQDAPTRALAEERLRQCHAVLGLLPNRMPLRVDFDEAVDALGMKVEDAQGDGIYNDLRIDRRNGKDGKPFNPQGISLKPFQVIGKLHTYRHLFTL